MTLWLRRNIGNAVRRYVCGIPCVDTSYLYISITTFPYSQCFINLETNTIFIYKSNRRIIYCTWISRYPYICRRTQSTFTRADAIQSSSLIQINACSCIWKYLRFLYGNILHGFLCHLCHSKCCSIHNRTISYITYLSCLIQKHLYKKIL